MACSFSSVSNGCGCSVGWNVPLVTVDQVDITSYPITVLNVNEDPIGEALTPSQYASIWNADMSNQAIGTLYVGGGAYCFFLKRKGSVAPPEFVLGAAITTGDFSDDFNDDFNN